MLALIRIRIQEQIKPDGAQTTLDQMGISPRSLKLAYKLIWETFMHIQP